MKADPKTKGSRNVGLEGVQKGEEPRASSGIAIEAKVSPAVVFLRRGTEQMAASFCLDFGREALLGRRAGRSVDAGIGKDTRNEIRFSVRAPETSVDVVLIEARPDTRAKLFGTVPSLKCQRRGRVPVRMPPLATPMLASRQSSSDREPPASRPRELRMSRSAWPRLSAWRDGGTARHEVPWESWSRPIASSRTRALPTSPSSRDSHHSLRADCRPMKFDVATGDPCAALEVARSEVLDSGVSRSHLGLLACDYKEKKLQW